MASMARNILGSILVMLLFLAALMQAASQDSGSADEGAAAAEREAALQEAYARMERIKQACFRDPESSECSCDLMAEDSAKCETAMRLARQLTERIRRACLEDPDSSGCSCSGVPEEVRPDCEDVLSRAKDTALALKERIEAACILDPYSRECSCDEVPEDGRPACEAAISQGLTQVAERRALVLEQCQSDLDSCSCSRVPSKYREDCELEKASAEKLRSETEERCRLHPETCSCDSLDQGKDECERKREEAFGLARKAILGIFQECFRDAAACDCRDLFRTRLSDRYEFEASIRFCGEQRDVGLNCMRAGLDCDRMDADRIIPADVPDILKPFVRDSLRERIEEEKERGVRSAMRVITGCLEHPERCDCSQTPVYAQEFCSHKKTLQMQCNSDNYTACVELDAEPLIPEYLPKVRRGLIESLVQKLKDAQKGLALARASKKVGNAILACMDSASACDCSVDSEGKFRAFCEHKRQLIFECREERKLEACFTLDTEPLMPEGVPGVALSYVEKNIRPAVDEKKELIYEGMRGDNCPGLTLAQCRESCSANPCAI